MKYRGRVRNGVVVLERASRLAEGTAVEVRPVSSKNGGVGRRKLDQGLENWQVRRQFHLAPHRVEIEARIGQRPVEVEDDAANHVK